MALTKTETFERLLSSDSLHYIMNCSWLIALLFCFGLSALAAKSQSLVLIPQPKKIEARQGLFQLSATVPVKCRNTDTFYAQLLTETLHRLPPAKPGAAPAGKIELLKTDSATLSLVLQKLETRLPFALGNEGYVLVVSPASVIIIAHTNAGVFYGTQTLIQLITANARDNSIPCLVIFDKPDMAMRGWQDDISRGPIPTLAFLKEEVRRMASFKLNAFTLYTEHVFKLKQHPSIAPRDGITAEEIKELSEYARKFHVDVIGNFQSFGHFENILKVPGYEKLAENPQTLSPFKEESYRFLKDAYSEVVPAYSSQYFHINCDEVSFANSASKRLVDSIGLENVYAAHICKIDSLLKPYHKRIMMWGDIAVKYPKIIPLLPKDMLIVSWGYAAMPHMDSDIVPFVKSGFDFIVAPGVSCWSRIYPDRARAAVNIYNYLRDGYKQHALGFINTTWDDNGNNLFNNNWYSLTWGAECGWNAPRNEDLKQSEKTREARLTKFNSSYNKIHFGTDSNITALMDSVSALRNGAVKNCLTDNSLWSALLPNEEAVPDSFYSDNEKLITTIDNLLRETQRLRRDFGKQETEAELMALALRHARVVAKKNLLTQQLKNNFACNWINYRPLSLQKEFAALTDTMQQLKNDYEKLWKLENRNWWLDTVLAKYNSFGEKLDALQYVCIIQPTDTLVNAKREIRLHSTYSNKLVRYTLDGTLPTATSAHYYQPLLFDSAVTITACVEENGKLYAAVRDSFVFHKGIGALHKLNSKWNTDNNAWAARGRYALLDGRRGSKNTFNDNRWQAYFGSDIDIELDFKTPTPLRKITMGFGRLMLYGILFPKQIELYTSADGINYSLLKTELNTEEQNAKERATHDYVIDINGTTTRCLKVIARSVGPLPDWHYSKGTTSWLMADEVVVE